MKKRLILAINPGSTSTKISLFEEESLLFDKSISHTPEELSQYKRIADQFHFRKQLILNELIVRKTDLSRLAAIVGRGGLVKPIESGIYRVNTSLKNDLINGVSGQHASNLGGLIASDLADSVPGAIAFIVDPVVVDELCDVARVTGIPEISRKSIFHALNQKAVARIYAQSVGVRYEDINLVIAHLGGGISIGAHRKGKVVDVNNALDGDGPLTPERAGSIPAGQLVDLCFSGSYSKEQLKSMLTGKGGLVAFLGTNDFREVCKRALAGDTKADLVRRAVIFQVSKSIGAMAAVLKGQVDAIILTGGIAHQKIEMSEIIASVNFISKVVIYPGEDEMKALAFNGLLALDKKVDTKEYI